MPETQKTTLPLHTNRGGRVISPSTQDRGAEAASTPRTTTTTTSWSPDLQRRQSWNAQDRKHELHKAAVDEVRIGPGFSERPT